MNPLESVVNHLQIGIDQNGSILPVPDLHVLQEGDLVRDLVGHPYIVLV